MTRFSSLAGPMLAATCATFLFGCHGPRKPTGMLMEEIKQNGLSLAQNFTGSTHGVTGLYWDHGARYPIISQAVKGSAAQKAQINAGDLLLSINGHCTSFLCEGQVMWMLRGPIGEPVKLELQRPNGKIDTVDVPRCNPAALPNSYDRGNLQYDVRPEGVGAPPKYLEPLSNSLYEAPWCLVSNGGAIVEFYDSKSGMSTSPPVLRSGEAHLTGDSIPIPPLFTRLTLEDPQVREFASKFGITQAPAYLFVGPTVAGSYLGQPVIEKDPVHNARSRLLPFFHRGCDIQGLWYATPGKF